MIKFDGVSSDTLGVYVERYPPYIMPAQKYEKISVPGRNGDLLFTQNAYENIEREYQIYISAKENKMDEAIRDVSEWLYKPGYRRLEDSYDPDVYRMAFFTGGLEVENYFNEFGKAEIKFDCMPQRWLKSGETVIEMTETGYIQNPTAFPAKPLIKVYGNGSCGLVIGGKGITLYEVSEYVMIDSESMNAYKGNLNRNKKMNGSFPILEGRTNIQWTSAVTKIEITPRWYTI